MTVMLQAHLEDTDKKFACAIKAYPEPAIVLASERQLNDFARFCCNPVDSLGDFDVNLLLLSNLSGKPPVMIGFRKTFQIYLFLASSMVGLKKETENLRVFGTDHIN